MKFRKKPVVIDAIRFTGVNGPLMEELEAFVGCPLSVRDKENTLCIVIPTLEGEHIATPGDWIIKGVHGECYPCKPDIFKKTYDPLPESPSSP